MLLRHCSIGIALFRRKAIKLESVHENLFSQVIIFKMIMIIFLASFFATKFIVNAREVELAVTFGWDWDMSNVSYGRLA